MSKKAVCWEVEVAFREMDMSGGDNIDGSCWTGKWLDASTKVNVVAPTDGLAAAAATSLFAEISKPSVQEVKKLCDVHIVVGVLQ